MKQWKRRLKHRVTYIDMIYDKCTMAEELGEKGLLWGCWNKFLKWRELYLVPKITSRPKCKKENKIFGEYYRKKSLEYQDWEILFKQKQNKTKQN